jgi:hypothetical protein
MATSEPAISTILTDVITEDQKIIAELRKRAKLKNIFARLLGKV